VSEERDMVSSAPSPEPPIAELPIPDVAVVVVNYDAGEGLGSCVASLLTQQIAEVVVVDNASSDDSLELLRSGFPSVAVLEAKRNLGYGRAANLGAAATSAPLLLICNPDLVFENGAVARLADRLAREPTVAAVGPQLLGRDGSVYPSARSFPSILDSLGHGFLGLFWATNPFSRRYRHLDDDPRLGREADWISGACLMVRREAFSAIAGFDERYFMYLEDVDLCRRLRRAGWGIYYEPGAVVHHHQGLSTARRPYRMILAHHRSLFRYARTTLTGRDRLLLPAVGVGILLRLVVAWIEHGRSLSRESGANAGPSRTTIGGPWHGIQ